MLPDRILILLTVIGILLTLKTASSKRKKTLKHVKWPKEKVWRLSAGRIQAPVTPYNAVNDSYEEEEAYKKYMAATTTQQTSDYNYRQPASSKLYPTWREYQVTSNARTEGSYWESESTRSPQDEYRPRTMEPRPKFNSEIDALTKNLQQISNDWYYNVRFHCANSWKMIQDILVENRKALNDWQSTLNNIIELLYIEDNGNTDYTDIEETNDQPVKGNNMDYEGSNEFNSTEGSVKDRPYQRAKWPDNDREYYTVVSKSTTEYTEVVTYEDDVVTTASPLRNAYKGIANDSRPGNLKLHVKLDSALNDSLSDDKLEVDRTNNSIGDSFTNKSFPNFKEFTDYPPTGATEYLKYNVEESTKVATENTIVYNKEKEETSDYTKQTTENSWLDYYNLRDITDSATNPYYDTTAKSESDHQWRYYTKDTFYDTTNYGDYEPSTESYWKHYYESLETSTLPYNEVNTPGTPPGQLKKYQYHKHGERTFPQELMVRVTSQKTGRKRNKKKKKKKMYSAKKCNVKQPYATIPLQTPDDDMSSDINLVDALRMYWKQSILECLSKYMKEVKEEERMARTFDKRMKIITASSLANFTEECKNGKKAREDKDEWSADAWQKLKNELTNLHQELERRYLNHEVQNLQITMGIETCRQVGLAYENTMHRQVKAIYSTVVNGRYSKKPVEMSKHYNKYQRHH